MSNIVTEPSQLAKVIGKGKSTIACCQNCGLSQLRVKWCPNEQYFWAINVSCLLCSNKWTICNVCSSLRVQLTGYAVRRHHTSKHLKPAPFPVTDVNCSQSTGCAVSVKPASPTVFETNDNMFDCSSVSGGVASCNYIDFGNDGSNFFFHDEKSGSGPGGGAAAIVKHSLTRSDVTMGNVHPTDVSFHMSTAQFVQDLTHNERCKFANVMSQTMTVFVGDHPNSTDKIDGLEFIPSQIPNSFQFIDRTYVRGKYAILQNLPHPSVIKVKDHSYVSLVDIVAHVLAFSTNIRCVSQGDVNALSEDGQVTVITTSPAV